MVWVTGNSGVPDLGEAVVGFKVNMYKYSWKSSTESYYACRSLELQLLLEQTQSKDRQSSELFQPRWLPDDLTKLNLEMLQVLLFHNY